MKAAVRSLAKGDKGFEQYAKLFKEKFVFLNEYTTSVKAEHEPRGPEGPYQFQERSVPVLVIKRWDGETLQKQFGWGGGARRLAQIVDGALKKNGPIRAPKALRPLTKALAKGETALGKKRYSDAIRAFEKVVDLGSNPKKFPGEAPSMVTAAKGHLEALRAAANDAIEQAHALSADAPKGARKAYVRALRDYGSFKDLRKQIQARLKALK